MPQSATLQWGQGHRAWQMTAIGVKWLGEHLIQDIRPAVVVARILLADCPSLPGWGLSWQQGCSKSQVSFASHLVEGYIRTSAFKLPWFKPETEGSQFPRCLITGRVFTSLSAIFFPSPIALANKVDSLKSSPQTAQRRFRNSQRIWTQL